MQLPMVDERRADLLIQHRPFKSWGDVDRVPGMGSGMMHDLRNGGATLGNQQGGQEC